MLIYKEPKMVVVVVVVVVVNWGTVACSVHVHFETKLVTPIFLHF